MDIVAALAASPLFEGLAPPALQRLASHLEVLELRGGATLFKAGDPADAIFLLVSGRLRAIRPDGQVLGEIARGEPIGEVGLLIDQPRSATIIAVRDSLVLRMDRSILLTLYHDFPDALLQTTRVMIRRMRETVQDRRRARARSQQAVAVIPATPELDVLPLATALSEAMSAFGTVGLFTPARVDAVPRPCLTTTTTTPR
jgi:NTE family protein